MALTLVLACAGFARAAASPSGESSATAPAPSILQEIFGSSRFEDNTPLSQPHTMPPSPQGVSSNQNKATGDWSGFRDQLENTGIWFGATWVAEGFQNFRGGLDTAPTVVASTLDVHFGVDTSKAFDWPGGRLYVDLQDHAGRDPSDLLVGDLQVFDKFNYTPFLQIDELWYQQRFLNGIFRLKVGKVDANTEFSVIDNGLPFLSSSTQVSPTIFVFPTFPDPMPSINVFFTPPEPFYASFGAYYANKSDHFLDFTGNPYAIQRSTGGTLFIGETGAFWHQAPWLNGNGNLRLGAWDHTGTFPRFNGSRQHGAHGFYAIVNQTIWKPHATSGDDQGLRMFLEYGNTQQSVSPIDRHIGGGFTWAGLIPERPGDVIGVSPQYAHLSDRGGFPHSYEMALEGFYRVKLAPWARLQPDLQYIIHPGGRYPNAWIGTLRLAVDF